MLAIRFSAIFFVPLRRNEGAENGHREDDNEISLSPSVGERELILNTPF
jgi:hypothetical protein